MALVQTEAFQERHVFTSADDLGLRLIPGHAEIIVAFAEGETAVRKPWPGGGAGLFEDERAVGAV